MKKKSAVQFDPHDYDYLDTLDKDGWHWEFTRRNVNYQKTYDEMERLRKEGEDYCKNLHCDLCEVISQKPCPLSHAFYVESTFQIKPFYKTDFGSLIMPDPSVKYSDLPYESKPVTLIRPIPPIKALTGNEIQKAIRLTWEDRKIELKGIGHRKYAMFLFVNEILSPNPRKEKDTLYIGISLHATQEELRKAFNNVLKKYVRPKTSIGDTKLRPEKRKSGLMIWDIRTNHRLSLKEAGDKIGIAEDTARKQFYRAFKLIYGKTYKAADFEKPEIKKNYLKQECSTCSQKPTCKDLCPDVFAFVNQDTTYQRNQTSKDLEVLTERKAHAAWLQEKQSNDL